MAAEKSLPSALSKPSSCIWHNCFTEQVEVNAQLQTLACTDVEPWHLQLLDLLVFFFNSQRRLDVIVRVRKCSCWSLHSPLLCNSQRYRHSAIQWVSVHSTSVYPRQLPGILCPLWQQCSCRRQTGPEVSQSRLPNRAQLAQRCPEDSSFLAGGRRARDAVATHWWLKGENAHNIGTLQPHAYASDPP